jgi:hypothetical protein
METADAAEVLSAISQQAVSELTFDIVSGPSSGTVARIVTGNDGLQSGLAEVLRRCPGGMQEDPAVEEVPVAQDGVWSFGPDETGLPNARVVVGDSRLIFTCYEGDIFFEYDFPKLHPDLSGLSSVAVAFGIDPSPNGWSPAIVSGTPISEGGGTYLTLFSGPAAIEWANAVRRANRVIKVAITQPDRGSEFKLYNITEFPAKGSTAAIKELQASCS